MAEVAIRTQHIDVTWPQAGASFKTRDNIHIQWESSGVDTVSIKLESATVNWFLELWELHADKGCFTYSIPPNSGIGPGKYRIRVHDTRDDQIFGLSGQFSIGY